MRVLVCGGRRYRNRDFLDHILDTLDPPATRIIHGYATGADILAKEWAEKRNVPVKGYAANWSDLDVEPLVLRYSPEGEPYNAAAGGIRNQQMLDEEKPDLVVAFPGGAGTADMVRRAKAAGVHVYKA